MGVLLHPSSLPGPFGIGDIGPQARRFVDWLADAGARVWQVLPLCPPGGPKDDIPYASWAALAGNPQLISLEDLVDDGLLTSKEAEAAATFDEGWAHPRAAARAKAPALDQAVLRLRSHPLADAFQTFRSEQAWALDAARFQARKHQADGAPWWRWPSELSSTDETDLLRFDASVEGEIDRWIARLFLFERQWTRLRNHARQRGISILGDIPIYVMHDSADVWRHREGWRLDETGQPVVVSGAPPDVFSNDGQLWGGPVYDWAHMAKDDFMWWRRRLERALCHVDAIRLDHFRAFSAYWEIPVGATSARAGRWVPGPGEHFFATIERHMGRLPMCAEDLGAIDDAVRDLLEAIDAPGMKILHYAFGDGFDNPYLPHNIPERSVAYPGNHDNDTTVGWWRDLPAHQRTHAQHYLGRHGDDIAWDLIRAALSCPARLAIIQMQDLLSLDTGARFNDPTSYERPQAEWRNWRWRLRPDEASPDIAGRFRFLGELYGRL